MTLCPLCVDFVQSAECGGSGQHEEEADHRPEARY